MITYPDPPHGTVRNWLDRRAQEGDVAFVFPDGEPDLDWDELCMQARRIAAGLTGLGIARGESVALLTPNCREGVIRLYGVLYGGFRATMINLVAGRDAVAYALAHSEARVAFVAPDGQALFDQCNPGQIRCLSEADLEEPALPLHPLSAEDHALLMYTSGTTGQPKGVVHTHQSLLAGGWTTMLAHKLTPDDRGYCVLPIYHINGLCVSVMGALVSGGSLAMTGRFSTSRFWDQIGQSRATWFSVVPTIISHLLHGPFEPKQSARQALRFGRYASSALSPDVHTAFEDRFGISIVETMGLTETAAQILSNPMTKSLRKIGSPGVGYGNEVCILSPDLTRAGPDEPGEIAVRGPNLMLEYLRNANATAEAFTPDGWLRTGDLGHQDADGFVFVTGRLKELIIKGGENIAPREIDEALYSHPDVIEAAAFPRPCESYGERVEAAVALRDGATVSDTELIELCRTRLGNFKSPDQIFLLDELPKGPSGKIQRRRIAELTEG